MGTIQTRRRVWLWPVEVVVWSLVVVSLLVLALRYSSIPPRVPVLVNRVGAVVRTAPKNVLSVFRLGLMGLDLQALLFVAKIAIVGRTALEVQRLLIARGLDAIRMAAAIKWIGAVADFVALSGGVRLAHSVYVSISLAAVGTILAAALLVVVRARRENLSFERSHLRITQRWWLAWLGVLLVGYILLAVYPAAVFGPAGVATPPN